MTDAYHLGGLVGVEVGLMRWVWKSGQLGEICLSVIGTNVARDQQRQATTSDRDATNALIWLAYHARTGRRRCVQCPALINSSLCLRSMRWSDRLPSNMEYLGFNRRTAIPM